MLPSWCNDVVTIRRAPTVTSNGRTERDWTAASSHTIAGCSLQPGATATDFADPARVEAIDATLYAPPSADIRDGDRVEFGGRTYGVSGAPRPWRSPTGAVSNLQANLRAWAG